MSDTQGPRSPCSGICTLDDDARLCVGCLRSGPEIGEWPSATDHRKREILQAVEQRRTACRPASSGQRDCA